jgi:hypothetical protein
MLHHLLGPYAGVDLRPYWLQECPKTKTMWERWVRCLMGLKPSPYKCIKALLLALEVVKGDRNDPKNPFRWSHIRLNLPGMPNYDPLKPRLSRLQADGLTLASLVVSYVDDMRAVVGSEEACWQAMHAISCWLSYLGIQIATRKTRPPATNAGPWSGSMVLTDGVGIGVKATQEKWDKTKAALEETLRLIDTGKPIDRKVLESVRGSLVYLQHTYPAITPYVKGFHLTIDGWRPDCDAEGWRLPKQPRRDMTENIREAPATVTPVPRFRGDIVALLQMFSPLHPPVRYVRSKQIRVASYSFADASGGGFGQTTTTQEGLLFAHGTWTD